MVKTSFEVLRFKIIISPLSRQTATISTIGVVDTRIIFLLPSRAVCVKVL